MEITTQLVEKIIENLKPTLLLSNLKVICKSERYYLEEIETKAFKYEIIFVGEERINPNKNEMLIVPLNETGEFSIIWDRDLLKYLKSREK